MSVHRFIFHVILFLFIAGCSPQSNFRVHMLDVGYGDCFLVELPGGQKVLVDAGSESQGPKVLNYLQEQNISRIDLGVITHPHENHFGGYPDLVDNVEFGKIWVNGDTNGDDGYQPLLKQLKNQGVPVEEVSRGTRVDFGGGDIEVFHPESLEGSTNNTSLVLMLTAGNASVLLMGDVEPKAQDRITDRLDEMSRAQVIQIPHHGDRLTPPITEKFNQSEDKIYLVSTGENPWGLPDEEFIGRLKGTVYRSDQDGGVILEYGKGQWRCLQNNP